MYLKSLFRAFKVNKSCFRKKKTNKKNKKTKHSIPQIIKPYLPTLPVYAEILLFLNLSPAVHPISNFSCYSPNFTVIQLKWLLVIQHLWYVLTGYGLCYLATQPRSIRPYLTCHWLLITARAEALDQGSVCVVPENRWKRSQEKIHFPFLTASNISKHRAFFQAMSSWL